MKRANYTHTLTLGSVAHAPVICFVLLHFLICFWIELLHGEEVAFSVVDVGGTMHIGGHTWEDGKGRQAYTGGWYGAEGIHGRVVKGGVGECVSSSVH